MKKEFQVGLLMLVSIAILIWGLNYLKGKNFFSKTHNYIVIYDDVSGLLASNGVYIKGYKVGHVSSISFSDSTLRQLKVILSIKSEVKIPVGTKARIYNLDLIGNKAVELIFSKNNAICKENDTIIGEVEITIAKQLEPYKVQAYNLLNSLDSLTHAINEVFNPATINHLKETIKHIKNTTAMLDESMINIQNSLENVKDITQNFKENNARINSTMKNFQAFSYSLSKVKLDSTIMKLDSLIYKSDKLITEVKQGNGTVSKLLYSDSLYTELNKTIRDLDSLLLDLKSNPKKYVRFSLFGGKK